jgi:hypothetical protein
MVCKVESFADELSKTSLLDEKAGNTGAAGSKSALNKNPS